MLRSPVALMTAAIAASIVGVDGFMLSTQIFVRADQVAAHRKAAVLRVGQLLAHLAAESLS